MKRMVLFKWGARKLKRYGKQHRKKSPRRLQVVLTALFVLPLSIMAAFSVPLNLGELTEQAALLAAMVNMPEGSIALLESRFADKVDQDYYNGHTETDIAPYMAPWPEETGSERDAPSSSGSAAQTAPNGAKPGNQQSSKRPPIREPSPAAESSHEIPEKYRGTILQENMAGTADNLIEYGFGKLRNYTEVPDDEVAKIMEQGMNIKLDKTDAPQILIFHTHATESYEPYDSETYDTRNTWRTTDNHNNMVAVGNSIEKELKAAGIGVIHDTTQHDYPSYNGSYERSAQTIKAYLKKYPSIKIALDVHRDAIQREDDLIVKPTVEINGKKAAQVMIITGSDDGTMDVPKWRENLRFAAQVQNAIEEDYPHLTRPIFFCYRKYNMDLTTGSILLEMGSNANTLEESVYSGELVGKSLARLLA